MSTKRSAVFSFNLSIFFPIKLFMHESRVNQNFKDNTKTLHSQKMFDNINARHYQNYVDAANESSTDSTSSTNSTSSKRVSRAVDLYAAASGYGSYCPEGIPVELALCLLLGGFALAFGILYRAVTKITGGRRKKRFLDPRSVLEEYQDRIADYLWWGRCSGNVSFGLRTSRLQTFRLSCVKTRQPCLNARAKCHSKASLPHTSLLTSLPRRRRDVCR